jgi:hypothetical protein
MLTHHDSFVQEYSVDVFMSYGSVATDYKLSAKKNKKKKQKDVIFSHLFSFDNIKKFQCSKSICIEGNRRK